MTKPCTFRTVTDYGETNTNLPVYKDITESMRQKEKEASFKYPNRYLTPRVLCWAWKNSYITAWDYSFYLSILDIPKPRKLSKQQKTKFHQVNSKVSKRL